MQVSFFYKIPTIVREFWISKTYTAKLMVDRRFSRKIVIFWMYSKIHVDPSSSDKAILLDTFGAIAEV